MQLKPISLAAVPLALEKAERYRLLNQPWAAESICLDILAAQPDHQKALQVLLLTRTDQFESESGPQVKRAREALALLTADYDRAYYGGIILERQARAHLAQRTPGAGHNAHEWITEAMELYQRAERLRPAGDDDAILRWNSCVRLLESTPRMVPREDDPVVPTFGE